jgi:hypothetical protein
MEKRRSSVPMFGPALWRMKPREIQFLPDTALSAKPGSVIRRDEDSERSSAMPGRVEDRVAVREEILDLLRQQMEALDSPLGLTDSQLSECYERQTRVQELREKLQASSNPEPGDRFTPGDASTATEPVSRSAQPTASADHAASV